MSPRPSRRRRVVPFGLALLITLVLIYAPALAKDWPRPAGCLGDHAQVVEPAYQPKIEDAAREIRQKTGVALVVATLPSLDGETIEQAAARLYQAWGIGQKGALILVAVDQRRVRIELGQGLAGSLGPARAGLVRDKVLVPHLREGRHGQGLHEGVLALGQAAAQEAGVKLEGLPQAQALTREEKSHGSWYLWGAVLLLLLVYALAKARHMVRGRKV